MERNRIVDTIVYFVQTTNNWFGYNEEIRARKVHESLINWEDTFTPFDEIVKTVRELTPEMVARFIEEDEEEGIEALGEVLLRD